MDDGGYPISYSLFLKNEKEICALDLLRYSRKVTDDNISLVNQELQLLSSRGYLKVDGVGIDRRSRRGRVRRLAFAVGMVFLLTALVQVVLAEIIREKVPCFPITTLRSHHASNNPTLSTSP